MSARLAAGCAWSRSHGVSVVPMIQCRPHGITKSTDFSVLVMKPASERIRSRGTTRWMPLLASTSSAPAAADHLLDLVGPDPGRVDHRPGPGPRGRRRSRGRGRARRPPARPRAGSRSPWSGSPRGRRCRRRCGRSSSPAGRRRPGSRSSGSRRELVGADVRRDPGELLAEEVLVLGHARRRTCRPSPCVVQRQAGADVRAAPRRGGQRVEERHRPDQVRGEPGEQQAALLAAPP